MQASVEQPGMEHWQEMIPHREDVLIDYVDTFKDYLVLYERKNGLRQIRISSIRTHRAMSITWNFLSRPTAWTSESNPDFDTNILRFTYSSLVTPPSVIDYHMDTGPMGVDQQEDIPSGYDHHAIHLRTDLCYRTGRKASPDVDCLQKGFEKGWEQPHPAVRIRILRLGDRRGL